MVQIITINVPDTDHLAAVRQEMLTLGAPTIRCTRDDAHGLIVALEGSHRIAAAHSLGVQPILVMLDDTDEVLCRDIGYDDNGWFDGEPATVAAIRERLASPMGMYSDMGPVYSF